jgi:hypothetical protein
MFAEALRTCASDVLAGDLGAISPIQEGQPDFSFSAFLSPADADYILALYGPWSSLSTISARSRHATRQREAKAKIRSAGQK